MEWNKRRPDTRQGLAVIYETPEGMSGPPKAHPPQGEQVDKPREGEMHTSTFTKEPIAYTLRQ
jgi:hypothetical protein